MAPQEVEKTSTTQSDDEASFQPETMELHWMPGMERRGLGNLIKCVNHVAIIVSDVGRSTAFYTDVLGLQQINRPNFDRHGAWLTIGNVELHLIKGEPLVHTGENLIVNHLSIDVTDVEEAFRRLRDMEIPFEVNLSVPRGKGKALSEGGGAENTLGQAFLRDPDGYYIEICNCHVLTSFALGLTGNKQGVHMDYNEGVVPVKISLGSIVKLSALAKRAKKQVTGKLKPSGNTGNLEDVQPLPLDQQPDEANPVILANFMKRQDVYGDICQSFEEAELNEILRQSGNHAPTAVKLMERRLALENKTRVFRPPGYRVESADKSKGGEHKPGFFQPQAFAAPIRKSITTLGQKTCKWSQAIGKVTK